MELFLGFILMGIAQLLDDIEPNPPKNHEELLDLMPKAPWHKEKDKSTIRVE
jgi:hypothetical protein